MDKATNPIDQIKQMYKEVDGKVSFIELVASDVKRSPKTLRNHWFAEFWSIPEEHQPKVIELLKAKIASQIPKAVA